ncbi:MAG: nucleotidyl transferase AbiEii/AbiGii toxin family protein [Kosmotoga sp.]|nr:MAG: nucleotidyl transferase AbiEii/AbiGii toxin family protein [Kosmotoga sp.]
MSEEKRNMAASVKARLLKIAKANEVDYTRILQRYAQERFLHRLSVSTFRSNLVLKGAMMFLAHGLPNLRPTKDIDFLGTAISNDPDTIKAIVKQISSISYNDGIIFDEQGLKISLINEDAEYYGVRIIIPWYIEKTKGNLQLDIGFGDRVLNGPTEVKFPTLLDHNQPLIMVYSKESALAEKLQIIVSLNYETSRMKDFYDIYYLCSHSSFKLENILNATKETFYHRNTTLQDIEIIFSTEFITNKEKQTQWKAFLSRNRLKEEIGFTDLMRKLKTFFDPLLESNKNLVWNPKQWSWKNIE